MKEYPKIYSPFKRFADGPNRNKFDYGSLSRPEFGVFGDLQWEWTEKIDGTNVRIHWDGHSVSFGGRTDNAQMPIPLMEMLRRTFTEELCEDTFKERSATIYGEGYGAKIQKGGGNYRPDQSFIAFDVLIGGIWLERDNVVGIARQFGVTAVPEITSLWTIDNAIEFVKKQPFSAFGDFPMEGVVGKAPMGILDRKGDRIMVKVKTKDFL